MVVDAIVVKLEPHVETEHVGTAVPVDNHKPIDSWNSLVWPCIVVSADSPSQCVYPRGCCKVS